MKLCHHPRSDSLNITVIANEVKQSRCGIWQLDFFGTYVPRSDGPKRDHA